MERFNKLTIMVLALMFSVTNIYAQTSDYQIKKDFEERHSELKASIDEAMTVSEVDSLMEEVSMFASEYEQHNELLDNALYPETYESSMKSLDKRARFAEHKLLIIENQNEKLDNLTQELASYKSEVEILGSRTDSLREAIARSEKSEEELSQMIERYRTSLQARDEFVLGMIDSLFVTYKDLKPEEVAELSEDTDARTIANDQRKENPLEFLQSVIEENTMIVKTGEGSLQTEDYLRMYVIQNRFNEVWTQIGDDLTAIYGGSNADKWQDTLDDKMTDWKATTSKNMWASIDEQLEQRNLDIGAFDSNESFYQAIDSFVKKATDSSREKVVTTENYEDFQAFYDFWNGKIKNEWGDFVKEAEVLTMSQISSIDTEVMNWQDEAKPRSFVIPILFGLSLLTIIGLIIVLARR